jgi:hypothetical protein
MMSIEISAPGGMCFAFHGAGPRWNMPALLNPPGPERMLGNAFGASRSPSACNTHTEPTRVGYGGFRLTAEIPQGERYGIGELVRSSS